MAHETLASLWERWCQGRGLYKDKEEAGRELCSWAHHAFGIHSFRPSTVDALYFAHPIEEEDNLDYRLLMLLWAETEAYLGTTIVLSPLGVVGAYQYALWAAYETGELAWLDERLISLVEPIVDRWLASRTPPEDDCDELPDEAWMGT